MLSEEQQRQVKVWDKNRSEIQKEVSTWIRRSMECDPAQPGFQKSLDEEIHWEDAGRGRWTISIPWQVSRKISEIEFEPQLPVAVRPWNDELTDERRIANRLLEVARQVEAQQFPCGCGEPTVGFLRFVAMKYRELRSCYYVRAGLRKPNANDKGAPSPFSADHWPNRLALAEDAREHDLVWAIETVMKGVPKPISSFYVAPQYSLLKPGGDYVRVVKVVSQTGKEWIVEAEAADYKSPEKMRELLNRRAGGSFLAGQNEFQLGILDWGHVLEWKEVELVTEMGWHDPLPTSEHGRPIRPAGAWFFADCAIDSKGQVCFPDSLGIITLKCPADEGWTSRRFKVSSYDESGTKEFFLGRPSLGVEKLGKQAKPLDQKEVAAFFEEFCQRSYDVIGSYDALAAIGMTLAYAAAPEIFKAHGGFPGIWLNGEARHGKSTFAAWLGRIFGVTRSCSVSDSTGPGTEGVLQQFSNLPPILDEAQTVMREAVLAMLKNAFNRIPPAKQTEHLRRVLTMPIVAGIATSDSAQLRSRYLHITVSKTNRLPRAGTLDMTSDVPGTVLTQERVEEIQSENYAWLESNKGRLTMLGRYVLEQRGAEVGFADRVLKHLSEWLTSRETIALDSRAKLVHGVAYAAMVAMCESLGAPIATGTIRIYRDHLIEKTREAMASTDQAGELDHFWRVLYQAFGLGCFGSAYDHTARNPDGPVWRQFFKVQSFTRLEGPPGVPVNSPQREDSWISRVLVIRYDRVIPVLEKYLRERNQTLKLREADIQKQAASKPYWLPQKRGIKHRFEKGSHGDHRYWQISLDHFDEFGIRRISDEEWTDWKVKCRLEKQPDPREGAFYQIVHSMEDGQVDQSEDMYGK